MKSNALENKMRTMGLIESNDVGKPFTNEVGRLCMDGAFFHVNKQCTAWPSIRRHVSVLLLSKLRKLSPHSTFVCLVWCSVWNQCCKPQMWELAIASPDVYIITNKLEETKGSLWSAPEHFINLAPYLSCIHHFPYFIQCWTTRCKESPAVVNPFGQVLQENRIRENT